MVEKLLEYTRTLYGAVRQRMVDYRRFDKIGEDELDSDEDQMRHPPISATPITNEKSQPPPPQQMTKKGKENRLRFEYQGQLIYEWEQSLEETNIYITPPPGVQKKDFDIRITPHHLVIGLKDLPPFIDEDTGGIVKADESFWMLTDGELNINLQKMQMGETWDCALKGRAEAKIDDFTKEEVRKKMMLERFQYEHPGFDFSGADFNGNVPDAKDFMGGIRHH